MRDEHRALVLYLTAPLLQWSERIECTMMTHEDALGGPLRWFYLSAGRRELSEERLAVRAQGVRAHGEDGLFIVKCAELLRRLEAESPDPVAHEPLGVLAAQREVLRRMALAAREGRLLGLTHRRAQDGIDETRKPLHAHALGELHGRVTGCGGRHLVEVEDLVEAEPQDLAHERLNLADGAADVAAQDPVERAARLHSAVDELRDKAAVLLAEVQLAQRLCKRHIGVGAVLMYFI